jgi:hypothetical protein
MFHKISLSITRKWVDITTSNGKKKIQVQLVAWVKTEASNSTEARRKQEKVVASNIFT